MAQPVIHTSFGAGELSKNLYARVDLDKFHVGAALVRNFFIDYRGGASTRAGLQFIAATLSTGTPRLIPFEFSTTQTYVLEFGNMYVRIYSGGLPISGGDFQLTTPYAESDLPLLKFAQSADTMTLTHPSYPVQLLTRTGANTFTLAAMTIGPVQQPPTGLTVVSNDSGNSKFSGYVVTALSADGTEESSPSTPAFLAAGSSQSNASLAWTAPVNTPPPSLYYIYKWGPVGESTSGAARSSLNSSFGFIGYSSTPQFEDLQIAPDFTRQPPQFRDPFTPDQPTGVTVTAAGGVYGNTAPPVVTMNGANPGLAEAFLNNTGGVGAVVITFPGTGTQTITFSPATGAPTAVVTSYTPTTGTYPGCCSYFQQRQCFAASNNNPQTIWTSQTGNIFNFDKSPITEDTDAITIALASRQVNEIVSMVPMPTGMVILTSGGAWLLSGGGAQLAMTPIDVAAQPQASSGANNVPPIVVNNDILYVQSRGSTVRDLVYNFYVQSYFGTDRSALANHLFFGYQILEWCYAEEPFRTIWAVRNDGIALCLTYVPEQEVFAWSHSDTQGQFISTCSVVEGQEDAVYFIVKRFISGSWVNYIERLHSRQWYNNVEFAFCVDSGLSSPQTFPAATITLSAASGNNVQVIANGSVFNSGSVGQVIRGIYGGKAVITAYETPGYVLANIVPDGLGNNFFPLTPNTTLPAPIAPNSWMMAAPFTTFSGLTNLEGQTVVALADGQVIENLTVSNSGTVTLPQPASFVSIGLSYQCQLETLYLDTGEPTIQGKRKLLPALTARVEQSRGLKVGPAGVKGDIVQNLLTEYKDPNSAQNYTPPFPLYEGDLFTSLFWDWTTQGQVVCQQDYPLPSTVLGLIPQVIVGDTGR